MTDASDRNPKVGYKRPPRHTRFQPGVSGNPRGRQKGVRDFGADVKRTLEIPVTLTENGKSKRVSTQEALYQPSLTETHEGVLESAKL